MTSSILDDLVTLESHYTLCYANRALLWLRKLFRVTAVRYTLW